MPALLLHPSYTDPMAELFARTEERHPGKSYKYGPETFGLDVAIDTEGPLCNDAEYSITFPFAASQGRDRVGDFLEVDGIDMDHHRKNPVAMIDHGKWNPLPIGKCEDKEGNYTVWIDSDRGLAWAKVFLHDSGDNTDHDKLNRYIFSLFKNRVLRAGSIGYRPTDVGYLQADPERGILKKGLHLRGTELLEVTLAGLPANGDAVAKSLMEAKEPLLVVFKRLIEGQLPRGELLPSRRSATTPVPGSPAPPVESLPSRRTAISDPPSQADCPLCGGPTKCSGGTRHCTAAPCDWTEDVAKVTRASVVSVAGKSLDWHQGKEHSSEDVTANAANYLAPLGKPLKDDTASVLDVAAANAPTKPLAKKKPETAKPVAAPKAELRRKGEKAAKKPAKTTKADKPASTAPPAYTGPLPHEVELPAHLTIPFGMEINGKKYRKGQKVELRDVEPHLTIAQRMAFASAHGLGPNGADKLKPKVAEPARPAEQGRPEGENPDRPAGGINREKIAQVVGMHHGLFAAGRKATRKEKAEVDGRTLALGLTDEELAEVARRLAADKPIGERGRQLGEELMRQSPRKPRQTRTAAQPVAREPEFNLGDIEREREEAERAKPKWTAPPATEPEAERTASVVGRVASLIESGKNADDPEVQEALASMPEKLRGDLLFKGKATAHVNNLLKEDDRKTRLANYAHAERVKTRPIVEEILRNAGIPSDEQQAALHDFGAGEHKYDGAIEQGLLRTANDPDNRAARIAMTLDELRELVADGKINLAPPPMEKAKLGRGFLNTEGEEVGQSRMEQAAHRTEAEKKYAPKVHTPEDQVHAIAELLEQGSHRDAPAVRLILDKVPEANKGDHEKIFQRASDLSKIHHALGAYTRDHRFDAVSRIEKSTPFLSMVLDESGIPMKDRFNAVTSFKDGGPESDRYASEIARGLEKVNAQHIKAGPSKSAVLSLDELRWLLRNDRLKVYRETGGTTSRLDVSGLGHKSMSRDEELSEEEAVDIMHDAFVHLMGQPGSREALEKLHAAMASDDPVAAYHHLLQGGDPHMQKAIGLVSNAPALPTRKLVRLRVVAPQVQPEWHARKSLVPRSPPSSEPAAQGAVVQPGNDAALNHDDLSIEQAEPVTMPREHTLAIGPRVEAVRLRLKEPALWHQGKKYVEDQHPRGGDKEHPGRWSSGGGVAAGGGVRPPGPSVTTGKVANPSRQQRLREKKVGGQLAHIAGDIANDAPTYEAAEAAIRERFAHELNPANRRSMIDRQDIEQRILPALREMYAEDAKKEAEGAKTPRKQLRPRAARGTATAEDVEALKSRIDGLQGSGSSEVAGLARDLATLTVAQQGELKKHLGLRVSGTKAEVSQKIAEAVTAQIGLRERMGREARRAGLRPADLHAAHAEIRGHIREAVKGVQKMLGDVRAAYSAANPGKVLSRSMRAFRDGDYASIPGFDELARTMAAAHPEYLGAHGYDSDTGVDSGGDAASQRLFDYLAAGTPRMPTREDTYRQALDYLGGSVRSGGKALDPNASHDAPGVTVSAPPSPKLLVPKVPPSAKPAALPQKPLTPRVERSAVVAEKLRALQQQGPKRLAEGMRQIPDGGDDETRRIMERQIRFMEDKAKKRNAATPGITQPASDEEIEEERKRREEAEGSKEKKPFKWDGEIHSRNVSRGRHSEILDDWNFYDDDGRLFPQTVRFVTADYDANPDDPDSEPIEVHRWESSQDGDLIEHGQWTTDAEEAKRDGMDYARENHQQRPELEEEEEPEEGADEDADTSDDDDDDDFEENTPPPNPSEKPKAPKFDKSKAPVQLSPAVHVPTADRFGKQLFGADFGETDDARADAYSKIASAVGAPDDATVHIEEAGSYKKLYSDDKDISGARGLRVRIRHPRLKNFSQFIGIDGKNKKFMRLEIIEVNGKGGGIGSEIFAKQAQNGSEDGFDYISLHAAGSKSSSFNGYAVWPKLGCDETLKSLRRKRRSLADKISNEFPDAKSILDILASPGGMEWWEKNGSDLHNAKFDLKPGSRSQQVLDAYMTERAARQKTKTMEHEDEAEVPGRVELPLEDWEKEALGRAWDVLRAKWAKEKDEKNGPHGHKSLNPHDTDETPQQQWVMPPNMVTVPEHSRNTMKSLLRPLGWYCRKALDADNYDGHAPLLPSGLLKRRAQGPEQTAAANESATQPGPAVRKQLVPKPGVTIVATYDSSAPTPRPHAAMTEAAPSPDGGVPRIVKHGQYVPSPLEEESGQKALTPKVPTIGEPAPLPTPSPVAVSPKQPTTPKAPTPAVPASTIHDAHAAIDRAADAVARGGDLRIGDLQEIIDMVPQSDRQSFLSHIGHVPEKYGSLGPNRNAPVLKLEDLIRKRAEAKHIDRLATTSTHHAVDPVAENHAVPPEGRPALDHHERVALSTYGLGVDRHLNKALLERKPIPENLRHRYRAIRSAFKKAKVFPKPVRCFHGIQESEANEVLSRAKKAQQSGKPIRMRGFLSTETDPVKLQQEDFEGLPMVFEIEAVHGLDMMPETPFSQIVGPGKEGGVERAIRERELLLNAGSRFEVVGIDEPPKAAEEEGTPQPAARWTPGSGPPPKPIMVKLRQLPPT